VAALSDLTGRDIAFPVCSITPRIDVRHFGVSTMGFGFCVRPSCERAGWQSGAATCLAVLLVLAGISMSVTNTSTNTIVQAAANPELPGQAVSLYMLAMRGPLGGLHEAGGARSLDCCQQCPPFL